VVVVVYLLSRELTIGNFDFRCRLFRNARALKDFDLVCSRELYKISLNTGPAILPGLLVFLLSTVIDDFV